MNFTKGHISSSPSQERVEDCITQGPKCELFHSVFIFLPSLTIFVTPTDGETESEEETQLIAAATSALFNLKADRGSFEAR